MKKFRSFLCVLIVGVMLLGVTACSPFNGNYKDASAEEIKTVNADIVAAMSEGGFGSFYKEKGAGMTSSSKVEMTVKQDGKENKMVVESSSQIKNVDDELQSAGKVKLEVNGDKLDIESYMNKDGVFMSVGDTKLKVGNNDTVSGALGSMVSSFDSFNNYLEPLEEILECDPEELAEVGIKVGLDKSDKFTKVKFTLAKKAVEEIIEADIEMKEYYIIVILDADKKLYGIKAVVDMTMKNGNDSSQIKVSGEMVKSDKDVKFPSFDKYEDVNATNGAAVLKELTDFMKKMN